MCFGVYCGETAEQVICATSRHPSSVRVGGVRAIAARASQPELAMISRVTMEMHKGRRPVLPPPANASCSARAASGRTGTVLQRVRSVLGSPEDSRARGTRRANDQEKKFVLCALLVTK